VHQTTIENTGPLHKGDEDKNGRMSDISERDENEDQDLDDQIEIKVPVKMNTTRMMRMRIECSECEHP
jgi:hypothetical protein